MMSIHLSSPDITEAERKAVQGVLKTPMLSMGPKIAAFERGMARLAGRKHAIAVNSGTSALHLILAALGIGKGDEVIVPSFSFIASSNCILYVGAKPVFVDIEKDTFNIDSAKIEKAITKRTKAILAVDVFGEPAAWDEILAIARKRRLKVIEDSAEAIGSQYKGKKCGGFGDASIFSFYPNKQMTTGEGGMVLTDDKKVAELCWSMTNQGRELGKDNKWLGHVRLGYNYRMTEMQAALGLAQLKRLPGMLRKRAHAASLYSRLLSQEKRVILPVSRPGAKRSWFVYVLMLAPLFKRAHRDKLVKLMAKRGVQCSTYFEPIHLQPFYRQVFGSTLGRFPHTEWVGDRTIALPFSSVLKPSQQHKVVKALKESMDALS